MKSNRSLLTCYFVFKPEQNNNSLKCFTQPHFFIVIAQVKYYIIILRINEMISREQHQKQSIRISRENRTSASLIRIPRVPQHRTCFFVFYVLTSGMLGTENFPYFRNYSSLLQVNFCPKYFGIFHFFLEISIDSDTPHLNCCYNFFHPLLIQCSYNKYPHLLKYRQEFPNKMYVTIGQTDEQNYKNSIFTPGYGILKIVVSFTSQLKF